MFEKASRLKIRFETSMGALCVEDLWDLPLTSKAGKTCLDDIARGLYRDLCDNQETSFVTKNVKGNEVVQLAFDVVKHIIDIRLAENDKAAAAKANADKKQQILAIINQKENALLAEASIDELRKIAENL